MRAVIRNALLAGTAFLAGAGTLAGGYYALNQRNNPPGVQNSAPATTEYVGGISTPTPVSGPITYLDESFDNGLPKEWRFYEGNWYARDGKLYGEPDYKWARIQIGDPSWYNYTAEIVFSGTKYPSVTVSINYAESNYVADPILLIDRGLYVAQTANQTNNINSSDPDNIFVDDLDFQLPPEQQEGPYILKIRRAGNELAAKIYPQGAEEPDWQIREQKETYHGGGLVFHLWESSIVVDHVTIRQNADYIPTVDDIRRMENGVTEYVYTNIRRQARFPEEDYQESIMRALQYLSNDSVINIFGSIAGREGIGYAPALGLAMELRGTDVSSVDPDVLNDIALRYEIKKAELEIFLAHPAEYLAAQSIIAVAKYVHDEEARVANQVGVGDVTYDRSNNQYTVRQYDATLFFDSQEEADAYRNSKILEQRQTEWDQGWQQAGTTFEEGVQREREQYGFSPAETINNLANSYTSFIDSLVGSGSGQ